MFLEVELDVQMRQVWHSKSAFFEPTTFFNSIAASVQGKFKLQAILCPDLLERVRNYGQSFTGSPLVNTRNFSWDHLDISSCCGSERPCTRRSHRIVSPDVHTFSETCTCALIDTGSWAILHVTYVTLQASDSDFSRRFEITSLGVTFHPDLTQCLICLSLGSIIRSVHMLLI